MNAATAILLVLTIITPPDQPDRQRAMPEPSIEKCWADAHEWIAAGPPAGALGVGAGCLVRSVPNKAEPHS